MLARLGDIIANVRFEGTVALVTRPVQFVEELIRTNVAGIPQSHVANASRQRPHRVIQPDVERPQLCNVQEEADVLFVNPLHQEPRIIHVTAQSVAVQCPHVQVQGKLSSRLSDHLKPFGLSASLLSKLVPISCLNTAVHV